MGFAICLFAVVESPHSKCGKKEIMISFLTNIFHENCHQLLSIRTKYDKNRGKRSRIFKQFIEKVLISVICYQFPHSKYIHSCYPFQNKNIFLKNRSF